jgi:integrase
MTEDVPMDREKQTWVKRWRYWIWPTPVRPGIYRRKEGGYLARGRAIDPRTGRVREILLTINEGSATDAYLRVREEVSRVRGCLEEVGQTPKIRFLEYCALLFERKIRTGKIKSAKSREKWAFMIRLHLNPRFGDYFLDAIRTKDIQEWLDGMAREIEAAKLHPGTANDRLNMLRRILGAASEEHGWERNPMHGIENFDTSEHPTYTHEEPNSLLVEEVPHFLAAMRNMYPQHYAMTALGFATGLRPSSLRPLRRRGPGADVKWDEGVLLVRRSHTVGESVMERTKTGKNQTIYLPAELVEILRWHVEYHIDDGIAAFSDLLFPSDVGSYLARSVLDKPFRRVAKKLRLQKKVTPRGMRRTYQDLARAAKVHDFVTRAISGHATEEMHQHYSTVAASEMRAGLAQIVSIAGVRAA